MHIPYLERFGHLPDFEVAYHIYSPEEGGRKTPAYQGIRWNFMYEEDWKISYMVFPEIVDITTREPFALGLPIPENGIATMWILNPELRPLHQQRIKTCVRGYFVEGLKRVAVCEVTRIVGLFNNPVK